MVETSMQKSRGSWRSASAACSFCFARICGGTTGTMAGWDRFRSQRVKAAVANASTNTVPRVHQSQAQVFGISTGGLIARISFVIAVADGGGTRRAELFEFIQTFGFGLLILDPYYPRNLRFSRVSKNRP